MKFSLLVFPTVDEILEMHERALADHGGLEGLRDRGLLESAAAAPQQAFGGTLAHPSIARMAGALAFSFAKNHAFVDGNKRVAHFASIAFLEANGFDVDVPPDWARVIEAVASGDCPKEQLAGLFANFVIIGGDAVVYIDDDDWSGAS